MTSKEVREKYLEFFRKKEHAIISSASLVPENDPTTLFTSSGMQPLVPYLLGEKHSMGVRLTNSQKSFRAEDIDDIGDNRHTTFFEMLGNWSLGDYFKKEQLPWVFEFLTDEIGIDPQRLYVTVFAGDKEAGVDKDNESVKIWKELFKGKGIEAKDIELITEEKGGELGTQGGRIFYYGAKKNWWSRSGVPMNMPVGEPGGPDSEIFYEFTHIEHDPKFGKYCHPNCDCGRFMEIGNSVFMEFQKQEDPPGNGRTGGTFKKLPQRNVDFGGGLERITAASNDNPDIFEIDLFYDLIQAIKIISCKNYEGEDKLSMRIVADHIRSSVLMISDGVIPSNSERGYVLRRLLRRAIRHGDKLGMKEGSLATFASLVAEKYKGVYDSINTNLVAIASEMQKEEAKFRETLSAGMKMFEKISKEDISGKDAFILFSSHGFPLEITVELAKEKGIKVDKKGFDEEFKKHQDLSRSGSEKKFKGGLGGLSEIETKYHTATHLLNAALRKVLGEHVYQKGSNITVERLRFDFPNSAKLTDEEKKKIEVLVNEKIKEALPVSMEEMPLPKAKEEGATGVFGEKYPDIVTVYTIGDDKNNYFSKEICGGPHVKNTSELGHFKIKKEEAIASGVRRIKAFLE
ncbi:MAG: alanyl-tRNA synthetase [Parcubacteria group bacterium GW2011_GWF2_38_76]|nr:MAG: alanyl-tRNA synthetase [Parcubacteria group bacterium GW2011_GWF2_38_76]HBM46021.1 alanine--tRNA ligase [Patescibacteria group bacterium]